MPFWRRAPRGIKKRRIDLAGWELGSWRFGRPRHASKLTFEAHLRHGTHPWLTYNVPHMTETRYRGDTIPIVETRYQCGERDTKTRHVHKSETHFISSPPSSRHLSTSASCGRGGVGQSQSQRPSTAQHRRSRTSRRRRVRRRSRLPRVTGVEQRVRRRRPEK